MNDPRELCVCRLCLESDCDLRDIFEYREMKDYQVIGLIQELLQLAVSKDRCYMSMVCESCIRKLKEFKDYKDHVKKCDNVLKMMLKGVERDTRTRLEINRREPETLDDGPCTTVMSCDEEDVEDDFRLILESDSEEDTEGRASCDGGSFQSVPIKSEEDDNGVSSETVLSINCIEDIKDDPENLEALANKYVKVCKEEEEYNNVPDEICNEARETVNPDCKLRDTDMSSSVSKNGSSLGTVMASDLTANDGNESFITDDAGLDPIGASAFEERELGERIMLENVEEYLHDAEIDTAMTINEDIEIIEHKLETYNDKPNWTLKNINEPHKERVTKKSCNDDERVTYEEGEREIHSETLEGGKDLEKMSGPSPSARQGCTSDSQLFKSHGMARRSKRIDSRQHGDPADLVHIEEGTKKDSKIGLYVCNDCLMPFTSKYKLHRHMPSHSSKNPHSCSICQKSFAQLGHLKTHMLIHSGEKPHSCSICCKSFSLKYNLKTHMLIHSGEKPHSCNMCHKSFARRSHLESHMLIHSGERPHSCSICHKSFAQLGHLKTHMLIHSGEKPHSCNMCHKSFARRSHLESHMLIHSGEKLHSCSICCKSFSLKYNLKTHMLIHSGERPQSCSICQKSFAQLGHLKTHMLIHSGEKPHSCNICHKSFKRISELKNHMLIHSGEKPHSCNKCHKSFARRSHLECHMLIHSGERPNSCSICHKSFAQLGHLKNHMLIHSGEKPHSCNKCHKSFKRISELKAHMLVHSSEKPHSCNLCHKSFKRISELKTHILIHSGEKPQSCVICHKSFNQISKLKRHMLIHSSEKPYPSAYRGSRSPK